MNCECMISYLHNLFFYCTKHSGWQIACLFFLSFRAFFSLLFAFIAHFIVIMVTRSSRSDRYKDSGPLHSYEKRCKTRLRWGSSKYPWAPSWQPGKKGKGRLELETEVEEKLNKKLQGIGFPGKEYTILRVTMATQEQDQKTWLFINLLVIRTKS